MKKWFLLVALFLTLAFLACCSMALADDGIEVPPAELISENVTFSLVDWHMNVMPIDEELKLTRMTAGITKLDSTHISVRGVTQTNKSCSMLGGYITVQQWKNNTWNNYDNASYKGYGTNQAEGIGTRTVTAGYYYRIVIDHYAIGDEGNIYGTSYTKSILVN